MKVILQEEVKNLGSIGDLVNVSEGYGRNFLVPQGKAVIATTKNVKQIEHQKRLIGQKLKLEKEAAQTLASKIEQLSCTITRKVGEKEKLFGSVTSKDIYDFLAKEGFNINKQNIILEHPIKELGVFTVPIRIHPEVTVNLKVWVVQE